VLPLSHEARGCGDSLRLDRLVCRQVCKQVDHAQRVVNVCQGVYEAGVTLTDLQSTAWDFNTM
jgi:hypothetical protein